ncbi:hypothetical protein J2Z34_002665 [Youngiibacter multivorans]|uniref:Apea-like HEPN domain-containing protein n=2 Tax=Youngiibacter multivorans TaxID=937251 RepID=A0ABS4G6J0_9CLOT|nr:hypothetical protein [Youngiibacter multivorans]
MREFYYSIYNSFCKSHNIKPLPQDTFFNNMRRHNVKLVQVCCPYCGNMNVMVSKGNLKTIELMNYCTNCGKRSTSENAFFQLSRLVRIQHFHAAGLKSVKAKYDEDKLRIVTYDIYQLELIEIASILEVMLRDFFISFVYINYQTQKNSYINNIINKSTGNDFMNIEKANNHYKKALDINLRSIISDDSWNNLLDIVNMRNTIVHNNGLMDEKFKKSPTYSRIQKLVSGDLIFLNQDNINHYLKYVTEIVSTIAVLFNEKYSICKYSLIANYYFNKQIEEKSKGDWISIIDAIRNKN